MARSALTRALRRIHRAYAAPPRQDGISRADFLRGATALSAIPVLSPAGEVTSRIAIFGGGLAGLVCAYRLHQAGIGSTVYEAGPRIGGRTWTLHGFADEQLSEHGGEFISSEHGAMRALARDLGLTLVNVNTAAPSDLDEVYYFQGARYTYGDAFRDYAPVYDALRNEARRAGYPTTYRISTPEGRALDRMSIDQWIDRNVPDGLASRLGRLLSVACAIEYGQESSGQSALRLIYLLSVLQRDDFNLAGTDEAYRVLGGNEQLAGRMTAALPPSSVRLGSALVAMRQISDGTYRCTVRRDASSLEINADRVVLALPFSMLRQVDTRGVPFSALKRMAIARSPMGRGAKFHLQFKNRLWNRLGYDGSTYSERRYQNSWETTRGQPGAAGILVAFPGGKNALFNAPAHAPATAQTVRPLLADFETLFPGITPLWNGTAYLDAWANDGWHRGSYSYYGVGDYTAFGGAEGLREGNVHFCGEHTSYDFQGYMNGAVVSGERVAAEISVDRLGKSLLPRPSGTAPK